MDSFLKNGVNELCRNLIHGHQNKSSVLNFRMRDDKLGLIDYFFIKKKDVDIDSSLAELLTSQTPHFFFDI